MHGNVLFFRFEDDRTLALSFAVNGSYTSRSYDAECVGINAEGPCSGSTETVSKWHIDSPSTLDTIIWALGHRSCTVIDQFT